MLSSEAPYRVPLAPGPYAQYLAAGLENGIVLGRYVPKYLEGRECFDDAFSERRDFPDPCGEREYLPIDQETIHDHPRIPGAVLCTSINR